MKFKSFGLTDPGLKKKTNEDHFLIDSELGLHIICDGVNHPQDGSLGSRLAATVVQRSLRKSRDILEQFRKSPNFENRNRVLQLIEKAIKTASHEVYEIGENDPASRGLSTTLTLVLILDQDAFIGHVGDSRVYLIRKEQPHQLTDDHTLLAEHQRKGLSPQEVTAKNANVNAITRAVGFQKNVQPDTLHFELMAGDTLILCTDGLSDYLRGNELLDFAKNNGLNSLPNELINFAKIQGGRDNIAVIALQTEGGPVVEPELDPAGKTELLRGIALFRYLNYQEILKVMSIVTHRYAKVDDSIIEEGAPGEEMFIIASGRVQITKGGQRVTLLTRGSFFGEMALIEKGPRSASAIAMELTKLMVITRKDFYALIRREPDLAVKLLWSFCEVMNIRLRSTTDQLASAKASLETIQTEAPFLDPQKN